jgi:uncharacterized protein involved in exopolysaccharide biosynthesis
MLSSAGKFGLRDNLATLFRHQRLILGMAVLAAFVSFAVAMAQSKVWESNARIVVQQNRQQTRVGAGAAGPDVPFGINRSEQVRTEIEIFSSPDVLAEAVTRLDPQQVLDKLRWRWDWLRELPDRLIDVPRRWLLQGVLGLPAGAPASPLALAMRKVAGHLTIEPVREAAVFMVSFESPDPQFSAAMVNALVDAYLNRHIAVRQVAANSGVFATETERLRAELEVAIERRQALKTSASVVAVGPQKQLLVQRVNDMEAALGRAEIDASETARRLAEIERQLGQRTPDVPLQATTSRNPMVDTLRQQLAQQEAERAGYQPGSAAARALDRELATLRARLAAEQEAIGTQKVTGQDTTYRELERAGLNERSRLSALAARADLKRQIETDRAELRRLDGVDVALREADREVDLKEEALRNAQRKVEDERLGGLLNEQRVSDVVPIERAPTPDRPVRPRVSIVTGIGAATGALAGLALTFLMAYFRRTLTTREDAAAQLGVPVLASLLDTGHNRNAATVNQIELRRLAEALRHGAGDPARGLSLLVTSTGPGEGKSLLVRELAALLGRRERGCVVLDAAGPTLTLPGSDSRIDLGRADAVAIAAVRDAVLALCAQHELVLIDGPALGSSGSGLWLPEVVDRVLLVVQAEYTTGVNATQTLRLIDAAGGQLVGVVLNRRRLVIPDWVYGWLLSPRQAMQP